ncbi:hypothetical protein CQ10_23240 [Bradyrhizobium valentinum]|uniref:Uncharacterized protein n=1 Tax=Bradyrhizobium valentinum TaxID=1518501 RepID=A0A0R3LXQ1_9BRAD|nr:hypothetical protein CQ10_23240 [Bradyrhizobium valentinum]KRR12772.1 hypothetical protein CP49_08925 [Bradyrhizobium valentinum]
MIVVLALTLTVLGCACLYLASPNQKWLSQNLPRKPLLAAGSLLLVAGLIAWIAAFLPLSGIFVTLHVAMVCLFAFPYAAALRDWRSN